MYIVTAEKRMSIPDVPERLHADSGRPLRMARANPRDSASVDELAGPDGIRRRSWAPFTDGPSSPKRGDGSYSISDGRIFTTAP